MNRRNIKMEILWEFSKKIGIFWHICGKNIEKIGLGKLKINRKSFVVYHQSNKIGDIRTYKHKSQSCHRSLKINQKSVK